MSLLLLEYSQGVSGELKPYLEAQFRQTRQSVWVNYGNSRLLRAISRGTLVLNKPQAVSLAVDKPGALTRLREYGVRVPEVYLNPNVIPRADVDFVVVKRRNHSGGRSVRIRCLPVNFNCATHYAEEFVPSIREFRVFVIGGRSCVREKLGGTGQVRNHTKGWTFHGAVDIPTTLRWIAAAAVRVLELDFGAADVGLQADGALVVYEVNSAPRLEAPSTIEWWKSRLERYILDRLED